LLAFDAAAEVQPGRRENPAYATVPEVAGLPRVLIIGDSISIGYTPLVRELLRGEANVQRVPANAGATSVGLKKIQGWLGTNHWDVIHFNFGLHDAKLPPEGAGYSTPERYEANLRELVRQLKATGAKLIWATSTPVPNGGQLAPNRRFADVKPYNEAAARVMQEYGVTVNDLNALIAPHLLKVQKTNDVHFTSEGSAILAKQVAASIRTQLPKKAGTAQ
jgi:acyl-CoA thioesterase-1